MLSVEQHDMLIRLSSSMLPNLKEARLGTDCSEALHCIPLHNQYLIRVLFSIRPTHLSSSTCSQPRWKPAMMVVAGDAWDGPDASPG